MKQYTGTVPEDKKYSLFGNIVYIFSGLIKFKPKSIALLAAGSVTAYATVVVGNFLPALAVKTLTDGKGIARLLYTLGIGIAVFAACQFFSRMITEVYAALCTRTRITVFFGRLEEKILSTDYENIEPTVMQRKLQRAQTAVYGGSNGIEYMMRAVPDLFIRFAGMASYAVLLTRIDWHILVLLSAMTVSDMLLLIYSRNYAARHRIEAGMLDSKLDYVYQSSTSPENGKDTRLYHLEKWFYDISKVLLAKRFSLQRKIELHYFLPQLSDSFFLFFRDFLAYSLLALQTLNGRITIAEFTFNIALISGFFQWMDTWSISELLRVNIEVIQYRQYMDIRDRQTCRRDCTVTSAGRSPSIDLENVSFRYPGMTQDTLSHITLHINAGEKLAIVGNNGAGKTTLVKLLSGLYRPTTGRILINGSDTAGCSSEEYQSLIGPVFQDVEVFALSIAENVAARDNKEADISLIWDCLEKAGLAERIRTLPLRENTQLTQVIDPQGIILSGGELQKMMLARALYKDAPILILDEPTSALDPIAESAMYEQYGRLSKGKTSIFISHRLASTRFCDRIVCLDGGTIRQEGTHDSLMKEDGFYREMFTLQSRYYRPTEQEEQNA